MDRLVRRSAVPLAMTGHQGILNTKSPSQSINQCGSTIRTDEE